MNRVCAGEQGFSLLELAIVLFVTALLVSLGIGVMHSGSEAGSAAVQRARLEQARQALVQFAVSQYRLPCPSVPSPANVPSGVETVNPDGTCRTSVGWLPYISLGLQIPNGQGLNTSMRYGVFSAATATNQGTVTPVALLAALASAVQSSPSTLNPYVAVDSGCASAQINPAFALALGSSTSSDPWDPCFVPGKGVNSSPVLIESATDLITQLQQIKQERGM